MLSDTLSDDLDTLPRNASWHEVEHPSIPSLQKQPVSWEQIHAYTTPFFFSSCQKKPLFLPPIAPYRTLPSTPGFCSIVAAVFFHRHFCNRTRNKKFSSSVILLAGILKKEKVEGWKAFQKAYRVDPRHRAMDIETLKSKIIEEQIESLFRHEISYREFLTLNGRDALRCLSPRILGQYHYRLLQYLKTQEMGYEKANTNYREALFAFGITQDELIEVTLRMDLRKFLSSTMPYATLRERNHPSQFFSLTSLEKEAMRKDCRPEQEFFSLSFGKMIGEEYAQDREFFGWTEEQIQRQVAQDLENLPYLGKGGFREKHGLAPLQRHWFSELAILLTKNRFLRDSEGCSYRSFSQYREDCELLGVSPQELRTLFRNDLRQMDFFQLVQKHGPGVFLDMNVMQENEKHLFYQNLHQQLGEVHSLETISSSEILDSLPSKEVLATFSPFCSLLRDFICRHSYEIFIEKRPTLLDTFLKRGIVPDFILKMIEQSNQALEQIEATYRENVWAFFEEYQKQLDLLEKEQREWTEQMERTICLQAEYQQLLSLERQVDKLIDQIEELEQIADTYQLEDSEHWLGIEMEVNQLRLELERSREQYTQKKAKIQITKQRWKVEEALMELHFAQKRAAVENQWMEQSNQTDEKRNEQTEKILLAIFHTENSD